MVYYLQQHSTILSQISQQIASIAPQVSIPSPPPPFPSFTPSASDIRINAFWFMALAFSLSAALLAILVQQWVRDYMHVFQRYSDPQKSSRMRQYLSEGSDGWYMPIAAEAVPGLLHVSLFLFFAGLADNTLNINTTIGLSTTIPIGICGLVYIFITLAPVIYPQSPYQTSFSGAIWYTVQKFRGRRFKDRDGKEKSVSTNMSQGQMQLSMEGTMDREGRDKRAILWLMDNLTEDNEIETFVTSMPGSLEAWTKVSNREVKPVSESSPRLKAIRDVLGWIADKFKTIRDVPDRIADKFKTIHDVPNWIVDKFKTICDNVLNWIVDEFERICDDGRFYFFRLILFPFRLIYYTFGLILYALHSIFYALYPIFYALNSIYGICKFTPHYIQRVSSLIRRQLGTSTPSSMNAMVPRPASRRPLVATSDHEKNTIREFCWRIGHFFDTCKNRAVFASDEVWRMRYRACLEVMASLVSFADVKVGWFGDILQALADIGSIEETRKLSLSGRDEAFVVHWTCLSIIAIRPILKIRLFMGQNFQSYYSLYWTGADLGQPQEFDNTLARWWGSKRNRDLSSMISSAMEMHGFLFNNTINSNIVKFDEVGQRITHELPGVDFDFPDSEPFRRQSLELFRDPAKLRLMSSGQPLKFFEYLKRVDAYRDNSPNSEYERNQFIEKLFWPKHLLQRMLWSHDDMRDGGLGFSVELFLLSLRQLLSTYPSQESYSALYIGTFRAITSDRRRYTQSFGTLRLLLDAVASDQGFLRTFDYPDYITDEVWVLLGDLFEVQGDYRMKHDFMDDAVQQLTDLQREVGGKYRAQVKALIAHISRLRASHS